MDSLPKRLLTDIDLQLNSAVLNVEEVLSEVKLTVSGNMVERNVSLDGCIIAAPPVPLLKMFPQISAAQRQYLQGTSYSQSVNVHLGLEKKPQHPCMYIIVPKCECTDITTIFPDHLKAPDRAPRGKGLLSIFLRSEWCAERYEMNDEAVLTEFLDKLRPYFGDLESLVERSIGQRWDNCALMITPGISRLMSGEPPQTHACNLLGISRNFLQSIMQSLVVNGLQID